jgi:hypothetical protein
VATVVVVEAAVVATVAGAVVVTSSGALAQAVTRTNKTVAARRMGRHLMFTVVNCEQNSQE